jgi:hypothetical protein
MKPIEIIAQDLFDKVRSRFSNLQMGDETGAVTASPTDARFFDFDFTVEEVNLGRVSISINDIGNLKIFYSQDITENADSITQTMWYDFLREMRFFAKRRLLRFDTRDITKGNLDKTDFQYLAQNGPKDNNMNESAMYGSSKTSHRKIENTDLIIRHSEAIDPTKPGARSRKIKNLFIQNEEGERFKFPFVYLPGARAMQRHVANGGYPHDDAGKDIIKTCEEILKLSDFGRKVKHSTLNDNAHAIAERAGTKLKKLRHHMECMSKQGYYESWKESHAPADNAMVEIDAATMESYKDTFTQTKFDEALSDVFPLLHAIMQEAGEVDLEAVVIEGQDSDEEITIEEAGADDEFAAFESWTESIIGEGFSDEELAQLEPLVQQPLPVGANDEAAQALAGIGIKDPTLLKALRATAAMPNGADADAREIIKTYLGADASKISFGDLDTQQTAPVAPQPQQEPAMAEETKGLSDVANKKEKMARATPADTSFMGKAKDLAKGIKAFATGKSEKDLQTYESAFMGPEDFPEWLKDATHRVAHGKVADWTELYAELTSNLDFDENKAERIAKRIYDHDTLAQHRVKPTGNIELPKDKDSEDDDEFLSNLRGQARSGSIKPGVDIGGVDEEDSIDPAVEPEDKLIEKKPSAKEIAEIVMGFYDRDNGTWTKGEHGVVTHVKRQFSSEDGEGGEKEAALAAKLIQHLNATHQSTEQFAEMRRLAGLPALSEAAKQSMSRAAKGNEKYGKDGMKALAKAGREGASEKTLDAIRDKHDNYNEAAETDAKPTETPWTKIKKKNGKPTNASGVAGKLAKDEMAKASTKK